MKPETNICICPKCNIPLVNGVVLDNDYPIDRYELGVPYNPNLSYGIILGCLKCSSCGYTVSIQQLKRKK